VSASPAPLEDDAERAREAISKLHGAATLGVDTEGDGMFRYRARLCTVQLAAAGDVHVIDTLAITPAPLLAELLSERGPEKIIHDVSFDARMLNAHGIALGNVFDTAIAARFLGLKNTGLSSLLAQFFGIELPKHKQQADWGERPLDEEALSYLADDVRHLDALAGVLRSELAARDIAAEVREECAYMLNEAAQPVREQSPFARVKGAALRPPVERARLYELAAAREQLAREIDLPPTRLITNDQLLRLAAGSFSCVEDLRAFLPSRVLGHEGCLWEALKSAQNRADAPEEEVRDLTPRPPSPSELERKKRRRRALTEFRNREATLRDVDLQVVLPGHCLSDIVELDTLDVASLTGVPGFGACRLDRYGTKLVAELTADW
jgi:ribonuclease D